MGQVKGCGHGAVATRRSPRRPAPALLVAAQSCGTVNRVTILTDKFGNPKVRPTGRTRVLLPPTWVGKWLLFPVRQWHPPLDSHPPTLRRPQGYAYVEFLEVDAVGNALLLDNTELRGRNLKVRWQG